jgi:hypothetical protein
MAFLVKAIGVPGDPLWLTAPNDGGERTLSTDRTEADVFTTRIDAHNGIAWLRRASLPAQLRAAVLYVVPADQPLS